MPTKERRNHQESERLRALGFEFDPPEDEYSFQPDSSGTIGGMRGKQEYGIRGGIADEYVREKTQAETLDGTRSTEVDLETAGLSEFSGQLSQPTDEIDLADRPDMSGPTEIQQLIEAYMKDIHAPEIEVDILPHGEVTLQGEVPSDSMKLRVEEIISAIPGVHSIDNCLTVRNARSTEE